MTIPIENVEKVRNAICEAGAGIIGEYSYCSTSTKSIGTFIPNENANFHLVKEINKTLNTTTELPDVNLVKVVIYKLREVHLYEELDIVLLIEESYFN